MTLTWREELALQIKGIRALLERDLQELDRTLEAANRENDLERRRALLQHAQRLVLADLPVLPLVVQWSHIGLSSRIEIPLRNDGWLLAAGFRWRSGR